MHDLPSLLRRRLLSGLGELARTSGSVAAAAFFLIQPPQLSAADDSVRVYRGLCDASAAESLDAGFFVVGDDEDNVLRVYHRAGESWPVASLNLSPFLQSDPKHPEADLEAAARIGDLVYWITSHGQNADGKRRPSRHRFFATQTSVSNGVPRLAPVGRPYAQLVQDLIADPRFTGFNFAAAAQLPPKSPGALNIEGLAPSPDGHLWIGFRNPNPQGRALLIPLLNPSAVIQGARAKLGDPVLLPLQGRGIRSITDWGSEYVIVAGSYDGEGRSELFLWNGSEIAPRLLNPSPLKGLNPEALARLPGATPGQDELLIVSDDGNVPIGGKPCKKLNDPLQKQFRIRILPANELRPAVMSVLAPCLNDRSPDWLERQDPTADHQRQ